MTARPFPDPFAVNRQKRVSDRRLSPSIRNAPFKPFKRESPVAAVDDEAFPLFHAVLFRDQENFGSQLPCASIKSSTMRTISSIESSAAVCGSSIAA